MVRAVLDANVFVSAFLKPRGTPGKILEQLIHNAAFTLVVSRPILDELRRCLTYPKVRKHLEMDDDDIELWLASLAVLSLCVPGEMEVDAVKTDPGDDKYLGAAIEGCAEYVVSGDHHLLELQQYGDVKIVTPRVFLDFIKDEGHTH